MSYILIILAVLALLNTYPLLISQSLVFQTKETAMKSSVKMVESALSGLPELTEEEAGVYRRGRNAKTSHTAKNASVVAYRKATGFEALMGYLYLTEQTDRLLFLVKKGLTLIGKEI